MIYIKSIYDNSGATFDRYTVVIEGAGFAEFSGCLSMSHDPDSPQGVCHHGECIEGDHLGKKVTLEELPLIVQEKLFSMGYKKRPSVKSGVTHGSVMGWEDYYDIGWEEKA